MLAQALFPLLLAGTGGAVGAAPSAAGLAKPQDPPVSIRLDKNGEYDPGHDAQVTVETDLDGFLLVIHADPQGRLRVLFPLEPYDDAFVEGGGKYDLVNRGGRGAFYVTEAEGYGTVFAALSEWPYHVAGFAKDHRWDYERLWVSPEGDIEDALVELVAGMAYDGWFDYDIVDYQVYGEAYYADGPSYGVHIEPTYFCCTTTWGVSVWYGDPYWPYYGPPYVFASYYRPYWYPRYYYYSYRPYYRHRAYWGGYPYRGRYAPDRYYRFKTAYWNGRDRSHDPYRPRGIGVDAGRLARGGDIDYRGRRASPLDRRATPDRRSPTGERGTRLTTVSTNRRSSPIARDSRPVERAGANRVTPNRSPGTGRRPSTTRPSSPTTRPSAPPAAGGSGRRTAGQGRPTSPPRSGVRPSVPGRRTAVSPRDEVANDRAKAARRPTLTRVAPRAGRPVTGQTQPSVDRGRRVTGNPRPVSRPRSVSRQPARRSPAARPSRPKAGRPSVSREPTKRSSRPASRSGSSSRKRPR